MLANRSTWFGSNPDVQNIVSHSTNRTVFFRAVAYPDPIDHDFDCDCDFVTQQDFANVFTNS